jgi:uncharacterized membrane protein
MGGAPFYIHFGFIVISVANLVVILLLIAVFAAAVALRWPGSRSDTIDQEHGSGGQDMEDAG